MADTSSAFERLPRELRRLVYEYLPERRYRSLCDQTHADRLYFEVVQASVALLRLNKGLQEEVTAYFQEIAHTQPIVLLCFTDEEEDDLSKHRKPLAHAGPVVRLIETGQKYDSRNAPAADGYSHEFDKWTLMIPMKAFERDLRRMPSFFSYNSKAVLPIRNEAVRDFYVSSLLKLRRDPAHSIQVRLFMRDPLMAIIHFEKATPCSTQLQERICFALGSYEGRYKDPRLVTLLAQKATSVSTAMVNHKWKCIVEAPTQTEVDLWEKQLSLKNTVSTWVPQ